jgi:hypothetical protein
MVMLQAYVNRGMWIAECPCRNAIALEPCGNAKIDGVDWPQRRDGWRCNVCGVFHAIAMPPQRGEIEALLDLRPVQQRNWYWHETVADLRIENALHHEELV